MPRRSPFPRLHTTLTFFRGQDNRSNSLTAKCLSFGYTRRSVPTWGVRSSLCHKLPAVKRCHINSLIFTNTKVVVTVVTAYLFSSAGVIKSYYHTKPSSIIPQKSGEGWEVTAQAGWQVTNKSHTCVLHPRRDTPSASNFLRNAGRQAILPHPTF